MEGVGILIIALFLLLVALSGIATAGFFALQDRRTHATQGVRELACSTSTDCPPGFACVKGHCVPEQT